MKKDTARELIVPEWSRWALAHLKGKEAASARDVARFLRHLQQERPTFLMFRAKDGPEETVRVWLREAGVLGRDGAGK